MKKFRKVLSALMAVVALTAMSVVPAMAATSSFAMYGYDEDEDAYVRSEHADSCIDTVTDNGNGTYSITFKVLSYSGATGYISEFNGRKVVYSSETIGAVSEPITFTYNPVIPVESGVLGSSVSFTVTVKMGSMVMTHPYDSGAIVIQ